MVVDQIESSMRHKMAEGSQRLPSDGGLSSKEIRLSDVIYMFPSRRMSDHGNVFEGEIRSDVYGVRSCVIKSAEMFEQTVREAEILSKLGSHSNVIAIIQSGTYSDILEDRFYIALDKCHDENLRQYLTNRRKSGVQFDLDQANDFAQQIISGVTYIHDKKVVHLDLKPSNILLSSDERLIKIADFGSSRELKSASSMFYMEGQFGTNGYRPVESFGGGWVSLRSDVFSLGAVIYHLLSNGEEVFGNDEHKCVYNIHNNVLDTSQLLVSNPAKTEHLIRLMLSTERCRRPTIWQVADHPCWTDREEECNFDYGHVEEIDESDFHNPERNSHESDDSDTETDKNLELLKILKEINKSLPPVKKNSVVIFDRKIKHLQLYNPGTHSTTKMHGFHDNMMGQMFFSVGSLGKHIYAFMSNRSLYQINYTDANARWIRKADMTQDHGWFPPNAASLKFIYLVGGSRLVSSKYFSKYDSLSNRWVKLSEKRLSTTDSSIVATANHVYCIGGNAKDTGSTNNVERFDVGSQSWEDIAPMREARYEAAAAECGGNIFILGGVREGEKVKSVEKYDPKLDQWIFVTPMNSFRNGSSFKVATIDGNILAISGDWGGTIEKYDAEKSKWTVIELPVPMDIYGSTVVRMPEE